ncbi:RING-H2 finger protein ATL70 [Dendrobium catenatum]|uniref:RING-H2 finger protein ATL70 n=1 Tax=Dendrobium catenatum TaxID=906689 RepID=A0A2I0VXD6_9ASPA|nr:RING-H2 finger protein ATL70 [Dendrobium catenatum]
MISGVVRFEGGGFDGMDGLDLMFAFGDHPWPATGEWLDETSIGVPGGLVEIGILIGIRDLVKFLYSCPLHHDLLHRHLFFFIIFLIATITYIAYLMWNYSVVSPPLQPERNADTEIDNATLSTWPTLTYAEAKSRDPRAVNAICCNICFVDYKEDEREDKAMRLLPECGHLFHATCVDPWLWRQHTCPVCRSLVVNRDLQMPLAEVIPLEIEQA